MAAEIRQRRRGPVRPSSAARAPRESCEPKKRDRARRRNGRHAHVVEIELAGRAAEEPEADGDVVGTRGEVEGLVAADDVREGHNVDRGGQVCVQLAHIERADARRRNIELQAELLALRRGDGLLQVAELKAAGRHAGEQEVTGSDAAAGSGGDAGLAAGEGGGRPASEAILEAPVLDQVGLRDSRRREGDEREDGEEVRTDLHGNCLFLRERGLHTCFGAGRNRQW